MSDDVYVRGDEYARPKSALYQVLEGAKWTLREKGSAAFVNDALEPFDGVQVGREDPKPKAAPAAAPKKKAARKR